MSNPSRWKVFSVFRATLQVLLQATCAVVALRFGCGARSVVCCCGAARHAHGLLLRLSVPLSCPVAGVPRAPAAGAGAGLSGRAEGQASVRRTSPGASVGFRAQSLGFSRRPVRHQVSLRSGLRRCLVSGTTEALLLRCSKRFIYSGAGRHPSRCGLRARQPLQVAAPVQR